MSDRAQRTPIKKTSRSTPAGSEATRPAVPGPARKHTVKVMFADGQSIWGSLQEYSSSGVSVNLTGVSCFFPNVSLVEVDIEGNFNEHLTAPAVPVSAFQTLGSMLTLGLLCPKSFSDYCADLQ